MSKKDFKGGLDAMLGGKQAESEHDRKVRRIQEQVDFSPQKRSEPTAEKTSKQPRDSLFRSTADEARATPTPVAAPKKRGRPQTNFRDVEKSSQEGCREAETRATFIVNEADLERIKAMAYWERLQIKDIINVALHEYIERYEAKNGPIKPKPEKK